MAVDPLLNRFCKRFGGELEGAEHRLLLESVPAWKRPLWFLVNRFNPYAFEHDREAIRDAARATSLEDVDHVLENLRYRSRTNPNVWRNSIKLRLSATRLLSIARKCFVGNA
ncbi:MAG TPA: hypothetical protein VMF06_07795 [Candidatus Limnocylindria bacterium]|jgi:hypothetical protein|nr:hypothetical protein [Candidatus Limnocylindria bacterium]